MSDLDSEGMLSDDAKILAEAKRRFSYCQDKESNPRKFFLEDMKFSNADSRNGYQWPEDIRNNRELEKRPCLTVNKTHQHNLQIINDGKQNKPSVKVRPVGNGATAESADVFEGIIRHIEYISNAQVAYDTASSFQVQGGIGYWRVVTDYADDDTFDQEIFIRRIKDPLSVYIDPDIDEVDGSDARFAFVFDDMPKDEFNEAYPEYKDKATQSPIGNSDGWIDDDHVRVAEYYRAVAKKDKLLMFSHPDTGEQHQMRASEIPEDFRTTVIDDPKTMSRDLTEVKIEWYFIVGDEIADRKLWAGKYIPIVRIIGEETVIDGHLDRKGHTRSMIDPQRIYNYWTSCGVEFGALQGKTPWIAPAAAIEGYETYWESANTTNHSVLPYNHTNDDGSQDIPAPQRIQPPVASPAYLKGMEIAQTELMMVSGQYEASMGQKSNEKSGKAINERQRQGENATYHFIDNQAIGIRFTGKILIDLIPKIYDTPRVTKILAEDGTDSHIQIDPKAQQAYLQHQQQMGEEIKAIFNPNVGKYDVQADIGPAYGTRRQETFNAMTQVLTQAPQLTNVVGDIMFKSADFPMAEEIAERLERMVPPQAKGEGPPPEVAQAQAQVQHMQGLLTTMTQELAEEKLKTQRSDLKNEGLALKIKGKEELRDIEAYDAITKRIVALEKGAVSPKDNAMMLHDLMKEEHRSSLQSVTDDSTEPQESI